MGERRPTKAVEFDQPRVVRFPLVVRLSQCCLKHHAFFQVSVCSPSPSRGCTCACVGLFRVALRAGQSGLHHRQKRFIYILVLCSSPSWDRETTWEEDVGPMTVWAFSIRLAKVRVVADNCKGERIETVRALAILETVSAFPRQELGPLLIFGVTRARLNRFCLFSLGQRASSLSTFEEFFVSFSRR